MFVSLSLLKVDGGQLPAPEKCLAPHGGQIAAKGDGAQLAAVEERRHADLLHVPGSGDLGHAALLERALANLGQTVGQLDFL